MAKLLLANPYPNTPTLTSSFMWVAVNVEMKWPRLVLESIIFRYALKIREKLSIVKVKEKRQMTICLK